MYIYFNPLRIVLRKITKAEARSQDLYPHFSTKSAATLKWPVFKCFQKGGTFARAAACAGLFGNRDLLLGRSHSGPNADADTSTETLIICAFKNI